MKVWRIQHCCRDYHGPLGTCTDGGYHGDYPSYGSVLETPCSDPSFDGKDWGPEHVFGTLPEQFPRWWSWYDPEEPPTLRERWFAVLYEVPEEAAYVGRNQVIFDSYAAVEILRTQTDFPK